jgi:hypothetical protein
VLNRVHASADGDAGLALIGNAYAKIYQLAEHSNLRPTYCPSLFCQTPCVDRRWCPNTVTATTTA